MKTYNELESACTLSFESSGPYWHLWTPENHPVIFQNREIFSFAMNIIAICALLCPRVTIITFQIMTNHVHFTFCGNQEDILQFFEIFKRHLSMCLKSNGYLADLSGFSPELRELQTLQDLRNVIVYNNRNGFVVNPDETPFTYPWGANSYFFNTAAQSRYSESEQTLTRRDRRMAMHSHLADTLPQQIKVVDGFACPMDYCSIKFGQSLFRCASHYFREISKNIESQKKIAEEIGERVYYTDEELFLIICSICKERYGVNKPSLLRAQDKSDMAILLHNDYNVRNKQIQRLLRLDAQIVSALFPERY